PNMRPTRKQLPHPRFGPRAATNGSCQSALAPLRDDRVLFLRSADVIFRKCKLEDAESTRQDN
ncbi:unnamed protein product, partial [Plutella xylostella]